MLTFHLGWGSWLCACGEQMGSPTRRLSRPRRIALTLFTDLDPDPPARRRASGWLGWSLLIVALVGAVIVALLPAPYVIEQPGPVYDVLGDVTVTGDEVPIIQIPMDET